MEFAFTYQVAGDNHTYFSTIWADNKRVALAMLKRTTPMAINIKIQK